MSNAGARPLHPISVVAERTGLSVDVLRVWQRRYGAVEPARDASGRRLYTDEHIERLRLLAQAVSSGRSIGQLTRLSPDELRSLVRGDESARWAAQRPPPSDASADTFVAEALVRGRALDDGGVEEVLTRAASLFGAVAFMEQVVAPLFRAVGDEWHEGRLTIAQEHVITAGARAVLTRLRAQLPVAPGAPAIVIGTLPGERHEIGALLVATTAAAEGWRVMYIGVDLPESEFVRAARTTGARAVAVSSVYGNGRGTGTGLRMLRTLLPAAVQLLAGGAAVEQAPRELLEGVSVVRDIAALRRALADAAS